MHLDDHAAAGRKTRAIRTRLAAACVAIGLLTGCGSITPARTEKYVCDEGHAFTLDFAASDRVGINVGGMRFALQPQPADGAGEAYGCDVLRLWRDGARARLAFDGGDVYENCRRRE